MRENIKTKEIKQQLAIFRNRIKQKKFDSIGSHYADSKNYEDVYGQLFTSKETNLSVKVYRHISTEKHTLAVRPLIKFKKDTRTRSQIYSRIYFH